MEIDDEDQYQKSYYVSVDPGTANFGVALITVDMGRPKLSWGACVNVMTDKAIDVQRIDDILQTALRMVPPEARGSETWVLEYQPPINSFQNPGLIRKNSYVEGAVRMWTLTNGCRNSRVVAPSAVKRYFNFPICECGRSQYGSNKHEAIRQLEIYTGQVSDNDHIADCALNALYVYFKDQK